MKFYGKGALSHVFKLLEIILYSLYEGNTIFFGAFQTETHKIVNSKNVLYGACRHRTTFHWYSNSIFSTDEDQEDLERVYVTSASVMTDNHNSNKNTYICMIEDV